MIQKVILKQCINCRKNVYNIIIITIICIDYSHCSFLQLYLIYKDNLFSEKVKLGRLNESFDQTMTVMYTYKILYKQSQKYILNFTIKC